MSWRAARGVDRLRPRRPRIPCSAHRGDAWLEAHHHRHFESRRRAEAARDFPSAHIAESAEWVWANAALHDMVVDHHAESLSRTARACGHRRGHSCGRGQAHGSNRARCARSRRRSGAQRRAAHGVSQSSLGWRSADRAEALANGELGSIVRFESRLDRWRPGAVPAVWREGAAPEDAGGILYDLGPHLIDQARLLFGPITQLYAELDRASARRCCAKTTSSSR